MNNLIAIQHTNDLHGADALGHEEVSHNDTPGHESDEGHNAATGYEKINGDDATGHEATTGEATGQNSEHAETHESTGFAPPTIDSEPVGHPFGFPVRNSILMAWITIAILFIIAWRFKKTGYKMVPGRFQNFIEMIIGGLLDFFTTVTQDRKQAQQFFGICATIFIFIILSNWMGLLPGVGSILIDTVHNGHEVAAPLFRSAFSDINLTLAIALISVGMTQYYGVKDLGPGHYLGKFFVNPLKDPIGTFVGLLEVISEIAKIISFSFRLYGNIFAGEVLLLVVSFLAPYLAPLPFYGLEVFVGFIQALVFALLTLVFMKMAVTPHGEHGDHHEAHEPSSAH